MSIIKILKSIKDFFCPKDIKASYLQGQLEGQQIVMDLQDKFQKGYDRTFNKKK